MPTGTERSKMVPNFTFSIRMTAGEDLLTSEYQLINETFLLMKFVIKLLHSTNQKLPEIAQRYLTK